MASSLSPDTPSRGHLITAAAAVLWLLTMVAYLAHPLRDILIRVIPDDALFYLVIARNAVAGRFSTFDGIDATNGYHPLWWLVVQPLALVFRGPGQLERVSMGLGLVAYAGAAAALHRALRPLGDAARAVTLAALVLFVLPASWLLTEAPLAILLFALFLSQLLSAETYGENRDGRIAVFAALTVMARLDAVLIVVPPLIVRAWDRLRSEPRSTVAGASALVPGLIPLAVVGLALVAYMAANLAAFGHAMPISGALKSSFPQPVIPTFGNLTRYVRGLPPLGAAVLWLGARAAGWRPLLPRGADRSIAVMLLGLIGYYAYELLFQKQMAWGVASWHFALGNILLAVMLGVVSAQISARAALTTAALLLALAAADLYRKLAPGAPVDTSLAPLAEAGAWIRENTDPSAVVAATDPGLIAWLGERRTISLDGLVNSYTYQELVRDKRLTEYLDENGVDYIATLGHYIAPGSESLELSIPSRLYWPEGDTLTLANADTVFTAQGGGVRLWRYQPAGGRAP